jgi:hypothetical protein
MVVKNRNKITWEITNIRDKKGNPVVLSDFVSLVYQVKAIPTDTTPIVEATLSAGEIEIDKPAVGDLTITLHTEKSLLLTANKKYHHAVKGIDVAGDEFEFELVDELELDAEYLYVKENVVTP